MSKRLYSLITLVATLFLILTSCAPGDGPTPAPAATPASVQPASPLPAAKAISPEETAWAAIVEAAKKEGKVTLYSYNFTGEIGQALSQAFKEKYGITADIITGRGTEFVERVKTEKRMGRLVADMTDGAAAHGKIMKKEGLTAGIAGELPGLREKDTWVADIFSMDPQDKHLIAFNLSIYTPYVNTQLVKPGEEPRTWKDLLDPKWKGKMVMTDTITSAGPYQVVVPLLREKVIDEAFLKNLYKQDLRFSVSDPEGGSILARGERSLSIRGIDRTYGRIIVEGAPIRAIELTDGTVLILGIVAAFNGGPHPNATKVFINWFLSNEGQTVYGKAATVASIRKDVPNFLPKAAQIPLTHPILLTDDDTEKATKLYQERWLDKLWGR